MPTPDDVHHIASMGAAGWVGWLVAVSVGALAAFRRIWHSDKVMSANTSGAVDTIQRLYDLLDKERANNSRLQELLAEANQRTDQANQERNLLVREIGEVKAQLAELQAEVRMLRKETDRDQQAEGAL